MVAHLASDVGYFLGFIWSLFGFYLVSSRVVHFLAIFGQKIAINDHKWSLTDHYIAINDHKMSIIVHNWPINGQRQPFRFFSF